MSENDSRLTEVWRRSEIPVVVRGGTVRPLVVKLPYSSDNYEWLRNERPRKSEWLMKQRAWSIPISWFEDTLQRLIARFGAFSRSISWKNAHLLAGMLRELNASAPAWERTTALRLALAGGMFRSYAVGGRCAAPPRLVDAGGWSTRKRLSNSKLLHAPRLRQLGTFPNCVTPIDVVEA